MRKALLVAMVGFLASAHAQVGLGVVQPLTLTDEGLRGGVAQVVEKFYYGEEQELARADLLKYGPWVTRTLNYEDGRLVRLDVRGGRTDGVQGHGVTTYTYRGECLKAVKQEDLSTRANRRLAEAETREELHPAAPGCRPAETFEILFGKPALRKAYGWLGDQVTVTAFRRDNSVAYQTRSSCLSARTECEIRTTSGTSPAITEVTRLTRTASGLPLRRQEIRSVDGRRQQDSVYTYNERGWLTAASFLNDRTGELQPGKVYRYPSVDARGNWTAQEEYRVDVEFGKQKLALVGYTTRKITYRR